MKKHLQKSIVSSIVIMISYSAFVGLVFDTLYINGVIVPLQDVNSTTWIARLLQDFLLYAFFPLIMIIGSLKKGKSLSSLGFDLSSPRLMIPLGILYIILLIIIGNGKPTNVYIWLYYLFGAAFSEEFIFRGIGFSRIYCCLGKTNRAFVFAAVASGIIWGTTHALVPSIVESYSFSLLVLSYIGGGILGSFFYSFTFIKSRTLFVPILIHASLDFISLIR